MVVTYTNRKNRTYHLFRTKTKLGKSRYFFAESSSKGTPCDQIPEGFEISESVNGNVSLIKSRPRQIHQREQMLVEALVARHPEAHRYRVFTRLKTIEVYEMVGPSADEILGMFAKAGITNLVPNAREELDSLRAKQARFSSVLRFILQDKSERTFIAERMSYLSGKDDWIMIGLIMKLEELATDLIPLLGTDEFFEYV